MRAPEYTTVFPKGSPGYVSPWEPAYPPASRYMAVHRVTGGGWGVVDRRTGRLVVDSRVAAEGRGSWGEIQAAVQALNATDA